MKPWKRLTILLLTLALALIMSGCGEKAVNSEIQTEQAYNAASGVYLADH